MPGGYIPGFFKRKAPGDFGNGPIRMGGFVGCFIQLGRINNDVQSGAKQDIPAGGAFRSKNDGALLLQVSPSWRRR